MGWSSLSNCRRVQDHFARAAGQCGGLALWSGSALITRIIYIDARFRSGCQERPKAESKNFLLGRAFSNDDIPFTQRIPSKQRSPAAYRRERQHGGLISVQSSLLCQYLHHPVTPDRGIFGCKPLYGSDVPKKLFTKFVSSTSIRPSRFTSIRKLVLFTIRPDAAFVRLASLLFTR